MITFLNASLSLWTGLPSAEFSITAEKTLAHFTTPKGWFKKLRISEIVYFRNLKLGYFGDVIEPPSAVFSVCHNLYQKLVFCWHVFWQMHKLQIHKLVSRHDHLNISTMYSVFDWKVFEIISYRWVFLESTKISVSEEPNALERHHFSLCHCGN